MVQSFPCEAKALALTVFTNSILAFSSFSFLASQALRQAVCEARPKQKVSCQGQFGPPTALEGKLMALRLSVASWASRPPDKKTTAGTAGGTVRLRASRVALAT